MTKRVRIIGRAWHLGRWIDIVAADYSDIERFGKVRIQWEDTKCHYSDGIFPIDADREEPNIELFLPDNQVYHSWDE